MLFSCAILFSLFTVFVQVRALGIPYLEEGNQIERHLRVLQRTATDPAQYRVLSEFLIEGLHDLLKPLELPHAIASTFILFRLLQNIALFLLAAHYYRRLGLDTYVTLLGLSLLAWGMSHSLYNSDLSFNVYFDVIFYLSAAIAILRKSYPWILPITALAALNRETSALIPIMLLAQYGPLKPAGPVARKVVVVAAGALVIFLMVFFGLRSFYGPRPPMATPPMGYDMLAYNMGRLHSWTFLFATLGILPLMAVASRSRWPRTLRSFFWTIVPVWFIVHPLVSIVAETRLFLVPHALVFIPGALFGIDSWGGAHGAATGPRRPDHGSP